MKKIVLIITGLLFLVFANANTILYSDDFESYTSGQLICPQNPAWWNTWDDDRGGPNDAFVSTEQWHSFNRSIKIEHLTDILLMLGNKTRGIYHLQFYMYVVPGYGGYLNTQYEQVPGNGLWMFEIDIEPDGDFWAIYDNNNWRKVGNFNVNRWFKIDLFYNLNKDKYYITIDDQILFNGTISTGNYGDGGYTQLGALNLWSDDDFMNYYNYGYTNIYFVDDFLYEQIQPLIPIRSWSIAIGIILILTYVLVRYRRMG